VRDRLIWRRPASPRNRLPLRNGDMFVRAVDYINDPQIDTSAAGAILDQNVSALLGMSQAAHGGLKAPI
jgi:hypothetical protein